MPLMGGVDLNGTASGDPTNLRFDRPYRASPTGLYLYVHVIVESASDKCLEHRKYQNSELRLVAARFGMASGHRPIDWLVFCVITDHITEYNLKRNIVDNSSVELSFGRASPFGSIAFLILAEAQIRGFDVVATVQLSIMYNLTFSGGAQHLSSISLNYTVFTTRHSLLF
eukprot:2089022-Pleurochrysis_carterae.AAC.1